MKLKQVVKKLNEEHIDNNFKLTELAAKRGLAKDQDWTIVRFVNHFPWRDFTPYWVELFEAIPVGWPLSNVAERLNCAESELKIVARYDSLAKKWV